MSRPTTPVSPLTPNSRESVETSHSGDSNVSPPDVHKSRERAKYFRNTYQTNDIDRHVHDMCSSEEVMKYKRILKKRIYTDVLSKERWFAYLWETKQPLLIIALLRMDIPDCDICPLIRSIINYCKTYKIECPEFIENYSKEMFYCSAYMPILIRYHHINGISKSTLLKDAMDGNNTYNARYIKILPERNLPKPHWSTRNPAARFCPN